MRLKSNRYTIIGTLVLLALLLETVVDIQKNGDFIGYLNAGYAVLAGTPIYADYLNTWPPFFSVFSVILAVVDSFSPMLVRALWLFGGLLFLYQSYRWLLSLVFSKSLLPPYKSSKHKSEISFFSPIVIVPLLLVLRLLLENSSHLQINLYMLGLAVGSVYFFYQNKSVLAGMLLGFSVGLKVYTIFILLFFIYKRAYKLSLVAVFTVLATFGVTILVFGWHQSIGYHTYWLQHFAGALPSTHFMNQSFMAFMLRLLTDAASPMDITYNITAMGDKKFKAVYYIIIALASIYPLWLFRQKATSKVLTVRDLLGFAVIFAATPILSPVAWKYYYVFLWLPFLVFYVLVYGQQRVKTKLPRYIRVLFYISILCTTFSSELFLGVWFSDVAETYGIILWGGVSLLAALLAITKHLPEAILNTKMAEFVTQSEKER